MLIDDMPVEFQVNCGSSINILPKNLVDKQHLTFTSKTLIMWNKTEVTQLEIARIVVTNRGNHKKYSVEFVVVSENLTTLLGTRAAQHMKLITVHWETFKLVPAPKRNKAVVHQLLTAQQEVTQYPDVFKSQLGHFPGTVKLQVNANMQPVMTPKRRIPTALKEKFKQELGRLQSLGVVAPEDKPTFWIPVVQAPIWTLRVLIDIPEKIKPGIGRLGRCLDITNDILIYGVGNTEDEANADHDQKLLKLLERCQSPGIALNPDKLKLCWKSITFMGHVVSDESIKIDPERAKAIMDMPRPTDVEGVLRLNGVVNYLEKFLPRLADSMEPTRRPSRKDVKWNWTKEQEHALQGVKRLLIEAPILSYYDPSSELAIQCDASQNNLGATLLQNQKPVRPDIPR
ncbi:hypothetical protein ACROYT_G005355 [Oculina patagonica]